jgi:putative ABC transport system permease protein
MFRIYFKIALRNLIKQRVRSMINIGGLALGMACCIMISLYVLNEIQYGRFHAKADRIFRVNFSLELNGNIYNEASIPFPAAGAFQSEFPEVINTVRLYKEDQSVLLSNGDKHFKERLIFADASLFDVFDMVLVKGDVATALADPASVIVTEETARKYFGGEDPIGKTLRYQNEDELKVTAVAAAPPNNSHLKFDAIAPLEFQLNKWKSQTGTEGPENKWFWTASWTYLLLNDPVSQTRIQENMPAFVKKYYPDRIKSGVRMELMPLKDIHLYSHLDNELEPNGDIFYVYVFGTIAVLTLLIAGINFINLTTAQSIDRIKEISIRKIVGAQPAQLVLQVLCEFILASLAALMIAIGIVEIALPYFNWLAGQSLSLDRLHTVSGFSLLMGGAIAVGLISGLYPAISFSFFKPGSLLRSGSWKKKETARKALVVSQFAVSITLIVAIGIIGRQLNFIKEKNLGFEKDKTLIIKAQSAVNNQYEAFQSELMRHANVLSVSGVSDVPGEGMSVYRFVPQGGSRETPEALPLLLTDYNLPDAVGIKLKEGRWFSKDNQTDAAEGFILNEAAVEKLGWRGDALGKTMELFGPGTNTIAKSGKVIGVIRDYHFESLHQAVRPLAIVLDNYHNFYAVKIGNGDVNPVLAHIERVWNKFSPGWPIEFSFLDSRIEMIYRSEEKLSQMINLFAVLAVVIALLGLYGLSAYAAERRKKEIGIRKVLGARVSGIVAMLSYEFIKMIAISSLIAWPVAYFLLNQWLNNFAYRISIDPWPFIVAAISAILLGLGTVSFHAVKAATANPVEALKYE